MSLRKRLLLSTTAFAVVLVVALVTLALSLVAADRSVNAQTERISPAEQAATQLLLALVDQETGLRGYALTADTVYLEPYSRGVLREAQLRAVLERLVPADSSARARLAGEDAARRRWHDSYEQPTLALIRSGDRSAVDVAAGKVLFDDIRTTSAAVRAGLASDLSASQARVRHDKKLVVGTFVVIVVVVAAALVLVARGLRVWITRPLSALGSQVRTVAQGDRELALAIAGPPELQQLAGDVDAMRLELLDSLAGIERAQADLERRSSELARSNSDLEQFAYVASHDLQEPLRKVASFCQLLEQRYRDQLDDRGVQYIDFAVDGAKRMQRLIADLLAFSRVGRTPDTFADTSLAAAFTSAETALASRVEDTGGRIEVGELPEVHGDPSLLHLLAQNLLGNALKFRRPGVAPVVRVSATTRDGLAHVRVEDNGIGIPQDYAEKVFVIFQRLHGRDEYEGTGIGLALVKKVVEFHGGSIELVPSELGGAGFAFTLPLATSRDTPDDVLTGASA